VAKLCERERNCVLTSFSLLRERGTLEVESASGTAAISPLLLFLSCGSALTGSRELQSGAIDRRTKEHGGGSCLSFSLSSLSFFRARAITLVCKGPLVIGMKVGSCVEMESPGPRLYTHLPTRTDGQDRARGPRPSSPIEPPGGGASLLVFSSPPFLDSTYLISLLVLHLLLSFSSSYTASRISAFFLSLSLSFPLSLASV